MNHENISLPTYSIAHQNIMFGKAKGRTHEDVIKDPRFKGWCWWILNGYDSRTNDLVNVWNECREKYPDTFEYISRNYKEPVKIYSSGKYTVKCMGYGVNKPEWSFHSECTSINKYYRTDDENFRYRCPECKDLGKLARRKYRNMLKNDLFRSSSSLADGIEVLSERSEVSKDIYI